LSHPERRLYYQYSIMRTRLALLSLLLFSAAALAQKNSVPKTFLGRWDASLNNSTQEVPFGLEIRYDKGKLTAAVLNGPERTPFTSAKFDNGELALRFEQYDGTLSAKLENGKLVGEYSRPYAKGIVRYPFTAMRHVAATRAIGNSSLTPLWSGAWLYKLIDHDGKTAETGTAEFRSTTNGVTGVLIPVSGDTGLLAGSELGSLSRFDGIHVMLLKFDAPQSEVEAFGSLKGTFESGKTGRYTFTATRKETAKKEDQPEDPFALTKVKDSNEPFQFAAPDPRTGKTVSASDPEFKNKVIIVDIMGTWCPNCHDEEPLLVDLYNRYHKDGLEVVGLAYEYTDDAARNARQIEIFLKKYNVPYPILIAGTTDDGQVQKTLPQLVNFGAFPTTIFIGRDGRVSKIHAGYTGPATGERFPAVQKELDEIVRDLVKTPATTAAR
jgi:thiol-disulfide isomerase/thioredoxin